MRYKAPNMKGWSEEDRQLWEAASPEERMRSTISIADLVREDQEDPDTPDTYEVGYSNEEDERPADDTAAVHGLTVASTTVVTHMRRIRDRLRSWGWTVVESAGWETRGVRVLNPSYIGQHHTGATIDIDRILRDGRSNLNGPLCNFAVHLDGVIVLMAAGTANHFGVATINNDEAYGIEATGPIPLSNTDRDAFPNYDAQRALSVAIRVEHGWGVDRIIGHKETARPDGRKPDPAFEDGKPGDGYPAPYPEMDRYRSACNFNTIMEDDMPYTEAELLTLMRQAVQAELTTIGDPSRTALYDLMVRAVDDETRAMQATISQLTANLATFRAAVEADDAVDDAKTAAIKNQLDGMEAQLVQIAKDVAPANPQPGV